MILNIDINNLKIETTLPKLNSIHPHSRMAILRQFLHQFILFDSFDFSNKSLSVSRDKLELSEIDLQSITETLYLSPKFNWFLQIIEILYLIDSHPTNTVTIQSIAHFYINSIFLFELEDKAMFEQLLILLVKNYPTVQSLAQQLSHGDHPASYIQ